jgi:hypothetical protein
MNVPVGELPACSLCARACSALFARHEALVVCGACLSLVARFAQTSPARERLWPAVAPKGAAPDLGEVPAPVAQVFTQFKQKLEHVAGAADAQTHLDLALAYRAMALNGDAAQEAATALEHHAVLPPVRVNYALGLLFDPGVLRVSRGVAVEVLREALFAN